MSINGFSTDLHEVTKGSGGLQATTSDSVERIHNERGQKAPEASIIPKDPSFTLWKVLSPQPLRFGQPRQIRHIRNHGASGREPVMAHTYDTETLAPPCSRRSSYSCGTRHSAGGWLDWQPAWGGEDTRSRNRGNGGEGRGKGQGSHTEGFEGSHRDFGYENTCSNRIGSDGGQDLHVVGEERGLE